MLDAINKTNAKQNHHPEPHTYVEIKVSYGLIEDVQTWNFKQKSADNSIYQQRERQYLPPGFFQDLILMRKVMGKPMLNRQKRGRI
ncbi:MAG: hypothetical protein RIR96_494, partial [Bacteroidota bacterium]